jgi:hypothetical protein
MISNSKSFASFKKIVTSSSILPKNKQEA